MRMENEELRKLKSHQKVNFLPAMPELCWKHLLHTNISKAINMYGKNVCYNGVLIFRNMSLNIAL